MRKMVNGKKGVTLIEVLVAVAVFLVISMSVYGSYRSILYVVSMNRAKINAIDLVNEELEIIRNMPYSDVGILNGLPSGKVPHVQTVVRDSVSFEVTTTIRNIDDPFDGTLGGSPNDLSPADFKVVEVEINCESCKNFSPVVVTTRVAPKNLETASTNGALFIKVFDANGNPVSNADVHVVNSQINPQIVIDDVTNTSGMLQIVDAPPGIDAYDITVSKSGYSSDQTVRSSVSNPNPVTPPATVALQQVTQISFIIDKVSTLDLSSVTQTCTPVSSIDFNIKGTKLIGQNPDVIKYDSNFSTNSSGLYLLSGLQWDTYSITHTDSLYDLIGVNPIPPISLLPNSTVSAQLIVLPKNPNTILVSVKDNATSQPLSGVSATLTKTGFTAVEKYTGQGFLDQSDWSLGDGQATSTDPSKFFMSDGGIEYSEVAGDIVLKNISGEFVSSGVLESSTFDTGSFSNFDKIIWNPVDQPIETGSPNVRFQIATNNDGGIWNYTGPDGTSSTFYTVNNQNISSINNGNRYLRYKVFLDSTSTTTTPNISYVSFTFTSDCTPSGQVYFNSLPAGTYNLHLSKSGYTDQDVSIDMNSEWLFREIFMLSN